MWNLETYPHLSKFLVLLLLIMHTTSEVERLFSLVSVTKTKRRGKMKTRTLEALMTIKKNLTRVQDLCTDYPEILSKLVVNRLARDNKRVESLQQQQHAENISEIEADSKASSLATNPWLVLRNLSQSYQTMKCKWIKFMKIGQNSYTSHDFNVKFM